MFSLWRRSFCSFILTLTALSAGCPGPKAPNGPEPTSSKTQTPLNLLVVDDPELGQAIAREWRSRTEESLTVTNVSGADLRDARRLAGDAIVFASGLLGTLAERALISPLDPTLLEDSQLDYRDIFGPIRQREMKWGTKTLAVPLGSPQFLFAYRKDIFEKLGLAPPADWSEYHALVARLADRVTLDNFAPPAGESWQATAEPLADGWAGQLLLARAAAYALHRDQVSPLFHLDTGAPLIDQAPYIRALEELTEAAKAGGYAEARHSPEEAMQALREGRCAMALTWPAPRADRQSKAKTPGDIAFALLPGGKQAYRFATKAWEERGVDEETHVPLMSLAGRMAAICSSSTDRKRAGGFVIWLAGREASGVIGPQSAATTLFRESHLADSGRWTPGLSPTASKQYAGALGRSLGLPRAFPNLRVPGRSDYLAALDRAVHQAVGGKKSPPEALAEAATAWREITEKIGPASQIKAIAHSVGQE